MSNVESQIVHALARTSPERIAVERAIYSAVERWTGVQMTPGGKGIPKIRNGTVHLDSHSYTLLNEPRSRVIDQIMQEAAIEGKATLSARLDRLRACELAVRTALDAYANLEIAEQVGPWPIRRGRTVERRIIEAMDLWVAFPTASEAMLDTLAAKIADAEQKLAKFPSAPGRPRNEAAHRVALQLAHLYADVAGRKPTYSENRDGLHGDFTPALKALFDALGWKRIALRGPAEAAVAAIADEHIAELTRPKSLFGGIFSSVPNA
ncbi:hypothetical protein [Paracoccus yeei]|uniref:hypothetical protein n=1 Tax=Paracoccus yeei TaxID=147645 RepID=UPI001C8EC10E|nr:hypothetical protein [Paracoccus yeei]MBY0136348.1 hypothetical protein [Paracoccus yeei]